MKAIKKIVICLAMLTFFGYQAMVPCAADSSELLSYNDAIERLRSISLIDKDELDLIFRSFDAVGARYFAPQYMYLTQTLLDLSGGEAIDFDKIKVVLTILKSNNAFIENYTADNSLSYIPLDSLLSYMQARKLEAEGDLEKAYQAYISNQILDSLDRTIMIQLQLSQTLDPIHTSKPTPTLTPEPTLKSIPESTPKLTPAVMHLDALRIGMTGDNVRILQWCLKDLDYFTGAVDGNFSKTTYDAVVAFQQAYDFVPDGVASKDMLNMLLSGMATVDTSTMFATFDTETDWSNLTIVDHEVELGMAGAGGAWSQGANDMTLINGGTLDPALITEDSIITIYYSGEGKMWLVGVSGGNPNGDWIRIAQDTTAINDSHTMAQVTGAQVIEALGEDFEVTLAILQCESDQAWEVNKVTIGKKADPIACIINVSPSALSEPGDVSVTITITNTGDIDMTSPLTLFDPLSQVIRDFGENGSVTLKAGEVKTWTGTWAVNQRALENGRIVFFVIYAIEDDNGVSKKESRAISGTIEQISCEAEISVTRTIIPETAREGQTVNVIYDIVNEGAESITNLALEESKDILASKLSITDELKAGESVQIKLPVIMAMADLTSKGTITYTIADGTQEQTYELDEQVITCGEPEVIVTLTADSKSVPMNEIIKLCLEIDNTGNVDYADIRVTDPTLGDVFTNLTLPAGVKRLLEKEITLTQDTDFQFTISATDSTGTEASFVSDVLPLIAADPEQDTDENSATKATIGDECLEATLGGHNWHIEYADNTILENTYTISVSLPALYEGGLMLVNAWHSVPDDLNTDDLIGVGYESSWEIPVTDATVQLFPNAFIALQEMYTDAIVAGMTDYIIREGFRSNERQTELFESKKQQLSDKYSGAILIEETRKTVNYPGTSEFQTGLSFRMGLYNSKDPAVARQSFMDTPQGLWVAENSWKYGIIFRFPTENYPNAQWEDKSDITGTAMHLDLFRFVGKPHAITMKILGYCLEEYVEFLIRHPHIMIYENDVLRYEIVRLNVKKQYTLDLPVTGMASEFIASVDNMGAVVMAFTYGGEQIHDPSSPQEPLVFTYAGYYPATVGVTFQAPVGWITDEIVDGVFTLTEPISQMKNNQRAIIRVYAMPVVDDFTEAELTQEIKQRLDAIGAQNFIEWKPSLTATRYLMGSMGVYANYTGMLVSGVEVSGRIHATTIDNVLYCIEITYPLAYRTDYLDVFAQLRETIKIVPKGNIINNR